MSLSAAKRSLAAENFAWQPGRHDGMSPHYSSEDATTSVESRTPSGSTPNKYASNPETKSEREANGTANNAVSILMKEFEQRRHTFDDEARALVDVRCGYSPNMNNPNEEFRRLKHRFEGWKKEYKARLRETKARLPKSGSPDSEISCRKWWGKISSRGL